MEVKIETVTGAIEILTLQEGDILVYNTEQTLSRDQSQMVAAKLRELTGWPNVVCVDGNGKLGAIHMEQARQVITEGAKERPKRRKGK